MMFCFQKIFFQLQNATLKLLNTNYVDVFSSINFIAVQIIFTRLKTLLDLHLYKHIYILMSNAQNKHGRKRWSPKEQSRYLDFLINFEHYFESFKLRKENKVFTQLASLIPTRSSHQIKSHHQKLMIKHGSVQKIISHLREEAKHLECQLQYTEECIVDAQQQQQKEYLQTDTNLSEKPKSLQLMLNSKLHQINIQSILKSSQESISKMNDHLFSSFFQYQFREIEEKEYNFDDC